MDIKKIFFGFFAGVTLFGNNQNNAVGGVAVNETNPTQPLDPNQNVTNVTTTYIPPSETGNRCSIIQDNLILSSPNGIECSIALTNGQIADPLLLSTANGVKNFKTEEDEKNKTVIATFRDEADDCDYKFTISQNETHFLVKAQQGDSMTKKGCTHDINILKSDVANERNEKITMPTLVGLSILLTTATGLYLFKDKFSKLLGLRNNTVDNANNDPDGNNEAGDLEMVRRRGSSPRVGSAISDSCSDNNSEDGRNNPPQTVTATAATGVNGQSPNIYQGQI